LTSGVQASNPASLEAVGSLAAPGSIELLCKDGDNGDNGVVARSLRITAIKVDSVEAAVLPSPVLLPDLVATPMGTSTLIENIGNAAAPNFTTRIDWPAHAAFGNFSIPGMLAGGGYNIAHPCRSGPHEINVDPTNEVTESDETNNILTATPCGP
jgi:hypothetical protein